MDARVTEFAAADAKARFAELLGRAEAGEEITIRRHGAPVAKLVPISAKLAVDARRQRRLEFEAWRDGSGPTLGTDLSLKDLIDGGRR